MSLKKKQDGILLETGTNEAEFLQFYLGKQRFGVNVAKVRQIVVYKDLELVSLPTSDNFFLGTVYVRGQQVGVINLGEFLNIKGREKNNKELLLICEFDGRTTGFIIDNVEAIYRCSWEEFQPVSSTAAIDRKYLVGSLIIGKEIVFILDLESIMGELNPEINIATYASKIDFKDKSCSDVKVLYCEDSATVRQFTIEALKKGGFVNLQVFTNGKEGYEFVKNNPESVDIIISDIEMPEMDGLTFCKKVKENKELKKIPFLFFSSLINDMMRKKCDSVGGEAAYSKPQVDQLVKDLPNFLGR